MEQWPAATASELQALSDLGHGETWEVQGRSVTITNPDKMLVPALGTRPATTKRDLVAYYTTVADALAPHLHGRPVNLRRFPDGIDHDGFWQRAVPAGAPTWVRRWDDPAGEAASQVLFDGPASLAWAANLACVELHPWTSSGASPDTPDWLLFDIDPGGATTWDEVLTLARLHRTALDHLGLDGRPMVTGSRGIHVRVPVSAPVTFDQTRHVAEVVSRTVGGVVPDLVSWRWHTSERGGRARLDFTQNARHRTLVSPYTVRARSGAPVAVPLEWSELDDPDLAPDRWDIRSVRDRLARTGDPLVDLVGMHQSLPEL